MNLAGSPVTEDRHLDHVLGLVAGPAGGINGF